MSPLLAPRIQNEANEQRTISGDFLREIIQSFLISRQVTNCAPGTLKYYAHKATFFLHWCEAQQVTAVSQIDTNLLRNYFLYYQEHHNPGGCHAMFRTLRAVFTWYEDESGYPSPMHKIKAPKVKLPPLSPASILDISKLLTYCNVRDTATVRMLLDTGMRASELLSLRISDVRLLTGEVVIRSGKGGKFRTVFIGKKTRKALRAYLDTYDGDVLFPFTYSGLRLMLQRRCRNAGIPYISPHQFRRTFALESLRAGCDIYSLQLLMGHSDLQVLRRYLAQTSNDLRLAHGRSSPGEKV